jgi:hypothetical protein
MENGVEDLLTPYHCVINLPIQRYTVDNRWRRKASDAGGD